MTEAERMADFARDVAHGAATILREGAADLSSVAVDLKSRRDPVSAVDKASERYIVDRIRERHPDHRILTEEAGSLGDSTSVWIVDPLDGTVNFLHGHPFHAVSIAFARDGRVEAGAVAAPALGETFWAWSGGGAYRNGERLHVSKRETLIESVLGTGFAYNRSDGGQSNVGNFAALLEVCRGLRRCGAAAIDLAYVAAGVLDGFWELYLAPWDVAAGMLMVSEAGGKVTDFSGGDAALFGQNIVASNGRLHEAIRSRLAPFEGGEDETPQQGS